MTIKKAACLARRSPAFEARAALAPLREDRPLAELRKVLELYARIEQLALA